MCAAADKGSRVLYPAQLQPPGEHPEQVPGWGSSLQVQESHLILGQTGDSDAPQ